MNRFSNFAFIFNLRRYNEVAGVRECAEKLSLAFEKEIMKM
jgi:hypothetical protein